jgi:ribonuclease P protein component
VPWFAGFDALSDAPRPASLPRLKRRAEFLRVAGGKRSSQPGLVLQVRRQQSDAVTGPRVGFTVTKKVGCAVERNRVKRRLREAAHLLRQQARDGHDYVVVGRRDALARPFADLLRDLDRAMRKLDAHAGSAA